MRESISIGCNIMFWLAFLFEGIGAWNFEIQDIWLTLWLGLWFDLKLASSHWAYYVDIFCLTAVLEEGDEHHHPANMSLSLGTFHGVVAESKSPLAFVNVAADVVRTRKHVRVQKHIDALLRFRFCAMGYVTDLPTRATWHTYWFLKLAWAGGG
jgi:hypothetical protein